MKIAQEEIFGPVMSILKFKNIDEVVARANKTHVRAGGGGVDEGHHARHTPSRTAFARALCG